MRRLRLGVAVLLIMPAVAEGQRPGDSGPTEEHAILAQFAGEWNLTARYFWPDLSAPVLAEPIVRQGRSRSQMVLGNRFLRVEDLSAENEVTFEGTHGFDTARGEFVNVGIRDSSNGVFIQTGSFDPALGAIVYTDIQYRDPESGGFLETRGVMHLPDGNGYTYEFWVTTSDQEDVKVFELEYRRR